MDIKNIFRLLMVYHQEEYSRNIEAIPPQKYYKSIRINFIRTLKTIQVNT